MPAQIDELKDLRSLGAAAFCHHWTLAAARRRRADRKLDLVVLTIGANDILFSGLIANVIIESTTDRLLASRGGTFASIEDSQRILDRDLPGSFARLRAALKPLLGGALSRSFS